MKYGILFDLDGTLLDTLEDLQDSVNHVMASLGYPQHSQTDVRRFVGNGARRLMEQAVPDGGSVDEALAAFQSYYAENCQIKTGAYPGIPEALAELGSRYPLAIVSNKPDRSVKILCRQYFPGIYARGESTDCPRKPAPDMVRKAMEGIGVDRCIYVGDSEVDVLTAANAGVPCVSVLWGFRDREQIAEAGGMYFCDSAEEMVQTIDTLIQELTEKEEGNQNGK